MKQIVKKISLLTIIILMVAGCSQKPQKSIQQVTETVEDNKIAFSAYLEVKEGIRIPFTLTKSANDNYLIVQNGTEEIKITDYRLTQDRLSLTMPIFGSKIEAQFVGDNLTGTYLKYPGKSDYSMPFYAYPKRAVVVPPFVTDYEIRERNLDKTTAQIDGKWSTVFSPESEEDASAAIGEFKQDGNNLTGTFMTETGDYRFLAGKVYGEEFYLSCFDGSHAFLFTGTVVGDDITGVFYSGNHWKENFTAVRNPNAKLGDPYKLTYLKEGYEKFDFSMPNINGETVSLSDERFKGKAVVLQILGTWCPNCMDETALYTDLSKKYKAKGIEFVGVAYESEATLESAKEGLEKYIEHFDIEYPILFGGKASKKLASEQFPMLNKVISFPTTIVLNKEHEVVKIHTGFSGPATSIYDDYVKGFKQLLDEVGR